MNAITKAFFAMAAAGSLVSGAFAQGVSTTSPATGQDNVVGIAGRDGITISDVGTLVTRNGVTQKVDSEIKLTNGATVRADGSILSGNGDRIILRPGQLLTFDGKLINPGQQQQQQQQQTTTTTTTK